jgi:hypothetical protein
MNEEIKPEENFFQEAETEEAPSEENSSEDKPKSMKKKWDFYFEVILFFVLGALVGIAVKTEADKKITIGFDDYKMNIIREDYDINQLQADLIKKQQQAAQNNPTSNSAGQGQVQGATPDNGQVSPDSQNNQTNQNANQPDQRNSQPTQ